ncbi:MAG: Adenylosuccinate synthetase [Parcubacteria group bacterium GW2011_GWC2_42_11]|nr:MAG: Adenylosuccinate synthetase [Parcubacteria group bacterium GW2011_GWC2_42_11]
MQATIVIDLGFGDAGKGTMVDYLSRKMVEPVIVRFNGGAQAAHNVVTPRGTHHTFSQFGSGTLVDGVRTFLSRYMLLDPYALLAESYGLEKLGIQNPMARIMVDGEALVVTPFHKAANRLREVLRGDGRHGSVGMGIGETMADMIAFPHLAVRAQDLRSIETVERKCRGLQELKYAEFKELFAVISATGLLPDELRLLTDSHAPKMVAREMVRIARLFSLVSMKTLQRLSYTHPLIFEGAQGVLIDEWHGFHPFTTWSTTTNANANVLLSEIMYPDVVTRFGVVRA